MLSTTSTTTASRTTTAGIRKRALVETSSSSTTTFDELQPRSRARRDVLSTEVETLKAELEHERSLRALDAKRFQKTQQRLERQVEFAIEEAQEAKAMMDEIREESEHLIDQIRQARLQAQEELREVQIQLDEERALAATAAAEAEKDEGGPRRRQLELALKAKATENEGLLQTIENLRQDLKQLQEQQQQQRKAEKGTAANENENIPGASEAPPAVLRELNRVRIQLAETERKNRQLRRVAEDLQKKAKQLVHERESNRSSTTRMQAMEKELKEMNKSHAVLQAHLDSWKEFGSTMGTILAKDKNLFKDAPPEAASIKRYINQATKRSEELDVENKHLQNQLEKADDMTRKLQSTIRELEGKEVSWKSEKADLEKKIEIGEKQVQLLKNQESIWKREVDSLRSIVKTFDELPIPGKSSDSGSSSASLQALEASLNASKEEVKALKDAQQELKQEIEKVLNEKAQLQTKHNTVLEKFGKLREAVYEERAKAEKAEARAVRAEQLSGKGAFDPETTRVLHLKQNPLVEALKQEVNVLKKQVDALTAGGKQTVHVGADVDPNKLHQRLKESFKEQIGRFREGVYLLTGFKIDMIPENDRPRFKVRSMFAEQESDHLMFKWPEGEDVTGLDLLDTELAKILMTTPSHEYIKRFHSLPAFLSSVQLSLFEKQTML